ncbi:hypothetical protein GETHLI_13180 [Geothrix limicola]|uniref:NIPSNAP domain-containing protein n=1 Tax=Geothrix limicola TaxID=2927978 RepID=A0ABQ5QEG7_9BACT|nr:NIPSNAP family protein [Geothrix limicola]GLH72816.1 hypothetical protein GETHLI_13180 [Geothrix limicola]
MSRPTSRLAFASAGFLLGTVIWAQTPPHSVSMDTVKHLQDYPVIEFRRYVTKEGERPHFVKYFDTYFPEAFEQLGAMVFGQFLERGNPNRFTWLRGYKELSARPVICSAFYYGPLWKEHRAKVNAILPDSDNVMLLRPLRPGQGIPVLPAVDPVIEGEGAQGLVAAQIFSVQKGQEEAFAKAAELAFARYVMPSVRSAGLLVSLEATNNFPQLPIREDGPFLVWMGLVRDDATLNGRLLPLMEEAERTLMATGLLRGAPERVVMDSSPRSRLRWLAGTEPQP